MIINTGDLFLQSFIKTAINERHCYKHRKHVFTVNETAPDSHSSRVSKQTTHVFCPLKQQQKQKKIIIICCSGLNCRYTGWAKK